MKMVFIWIFSLILLSACETQPIEPEKIEAENPDSALLTVFLQTEDFSPEWTWISKDTFQSSASPDADNHYLLEKASVTRAGKLDGATYFAILYEGLLRYRDIPEAPDAALIFEDSTGSEPFTIALGQYGEETRSACQVKKDSSLKNCKIVANYAHISHVLSLMVSPGSLPDERIGQAMDSWLKIVDQRIGALDSAAQGRTPTPDSALPFLLAGWPVH